MKFERNELIEAIQYIDEHPEAKHRRESSTYDLIFEGKPYPPILVLSIANKLKNGKELTLKSFNNSTEKAFKILKKADFEVVKKEIDPLALSQAFKTFQQIYKQEKAGRFSGSTESFKLLVNRVPKIIENRFNLFDEYKVEGSVGKGNFTNYP